MPTKRFRLLGPDQVILGPEHSIVQLVALVVLLLAQHHVLL